MSTEFNRHWKRYTALPVNAGPDYYGIAVPDASDEVVKRADLLRGARRKRTAGGCARPRQLLPALVGHQDGRTRLHR